MNKLDLSTLYGIALALGILIFSISLSTDLTKYFNLESALIVVGSTLAISCASFSFKDVWNAVKTILYAMVLSPASATEIAILAMQSAEYAYKNGAHGITTKEDLPIHGGLFTKWLSFVCDGEKFENIDNLITQEIYTMQEQHSIVVQILRKAAELAPAYGLIGTLVGLVHMLDNLQDINTIGIGLSVALLTTFYGALLSYMFLVPLASKLERNFKADILHYRILHRTILSIAQRENPRQLEPVLDSILPSGKKLSYYKY